MSSCDGGIIAAAVIVPLVITHPIAIFLTWYLTKKRLTPAPPPIEDDHTNPRFSVPQNSGFNGNPNAGFEHPSESEFDDDDHDIYDQVPDETIKHEHAKDQKNFARSVENLSKTGVKNGPYVTMHSAESTYEKYFPDEPKNLPSPVESQSKVVTTTSPGIIAQNSVENEGGDEGIYEEYDVTNEADVSKTRKPTLKPKPKRYMDGN